MKCSKCSKEHDGTGLPPSLQGKMSICVRCYKQQKKTSDNNWRKKNSEKVYSYSLKQYKERSPLEKAKSWRIRKLYYRYRKRFKKIMGIVLNKATDLEKERALKDDILFKIKEDLDAEREAFKILSKRK